MTKRFFGHFLRSQAVLASTVSLLLISPGCTTGPGAPLTGAQPSPGSTVAAGPSSLKAPTGGFAVGGKLLQAAGYRINSLVAVQKVVLVFTDGSSLTSVPGADGGFKFEVAVQAGKPLPQVGALQVVFADGTKQFISFATGGSAKQDYVKYAPDTAYDLGGVTASPTGASAEHNPLELTDSDGDGQKDAVDADDDGDRAPDANDQGAFCYDPHENHDNDGDGMGDNSDSDDDNDGTTDANDSDDDGDGTPDVSDADDDGDGLDDQLADLDVPDGDHDNDDDGTPDEADADDDNDGVSDATDPDQDGDGTPDAADADDDNDGIADAGDAAADGDGDGVADFFDAAPNDAAATTVKVEIAFKLLPADEDYDCVADAQDTDDDGDGVADAEDTDDDGDGVADLEDGDDNNDGLPDLAAGAPDRDNDGLPDQFDTDDDGVEGQDSDFNAELAYVDSDDDGLPDFADADDDGDGSDDAADDDDDGDGTSDAADADPGSTNYRA